MAWSIDPAWTRHVLRDKQMTDTSTIIGTLHEMLISQKDFALSVYRDHYGHDYHHDYVDHDRSLLSVNDSSDGDDDTLDRCCRHPANLFVASNAPSKTAGNTVTVS
jgi:hypothetical protein